ncbi:hypothetical protein [Kribbella shirazensis]|uniref:Uncharacterized protein n=1 Tax=Kribbella shirazensis TaxID=1105143 RepID=A0A7X5V662_9ACTN|nr:hypothetical protein [Kribbella shirazensis]NIK54916.1 hypothetical protein [Kribbella shirazensis]
MVAQHIAGLPVEEILLAALAAASPVITLVVLEIRSRIKRLKRFLRRAADPSHSPTRPDPLLPVARERDEPAPRMVGEWGTSAARLRDYEFGGSESGQGVDG